MITINLQYIAFILWSVAVWKLFYGIKVFCKTAGTADFGPSVGIVIMITQSFQSMIWATVGWLVWRAFS